MGTFLEECRQYEENYLEMLRKKQEEVREETSRVTAERNTSEAFKFIGKMKDLFQEAIRDKVYFVPWSIPFGECIETMLYFHILSGQSKLIQDWARKEGFWTNVVLDEKRLDNNSGTRYFVLVIALPPKEG